MEKLTAQQIIEKLNSLEETYESEWGGFKNDFGYHDLDTDQEDTKEDIKELGKMEYIVDSDRALEGDAECMTTVILFKDHGVYIRLDGFYASYGESEWDGEYHEVKPIEKTVTFYEAVKEEKES